MALVPVEEARALLLRDVAPTAVETVALARAAGRTLAADVAAARTQPPFDASAMDGYAVRAADIAAVPARLRVVGSAAAGHAHGGTVGPREAVRIFTGAPLPDGTDTVLIQENARADGEHVEALQATPEGRNVRRAGLDFRSGDVLLHAGRMIDERAVALAAAMNRAELAVRRRPRIALLATGDELVAPGEMPAADQIVASNGIALAALVERAGGEAIDLGIAPDDLATIESRIASAEDADVVVLLGGASVGDHDFTRAALERRGFALDFWKIAMRPGKPLMAGRDGRRIALGLPGNPVASLVCGRLFLVPLIARLLGRDDGAPATEPAVLGIDLATNDLREDYLRARLARDGDRLVATPFAVQDSSMLAVLAAADCLVVRPPHAPAAKAGDACRIIRL